MDNIFPLIAPPIISASGCWAQTEEQVQAILATDIGAVCLKTCTLKPRVGIAEPNLVKHGDFTFNAKGLPNQGYPFYKKLFLKYHLRNNKPLILSIAFENSDILAYILDDLNTLHLSPIIVELNLGCPNTPTQGIPGYHLNTIKKILLLLQEKKYQKLVIGLKCPPYLNKCMIKKISTLIRQYSSIQFITLSNSIPNTICFIHNQAALSTTFGGMSGPANKYINLGEIALFREYLNHHQINLIGCGGIATIDDVLEYRSCGASYVQIASCFYDEKKNLLNSVHINELVQQFLVRS